MAIIPGVYQAKNAISDNSQQGSKFNSIVNAIVNPANTSLLTGFDPVIEEVSSPNAGTVVTYTPQTVSGTPPLALPNSAGQPLQAWSVDVLPYQEGSGDPSPDNVRAIHGTNQISFVTTGKNLLNKTDFVAETANTTVTTTDTGIKILVTGNGSYRFAINRTVIDYASVAGKTVTLSYHNTNLDGGIARYRISLYKQDGTLKQSLAENAQSNDGNVTKTITVPDNVADAYSLGIVLYANDDHANGASVEYSNLQLEFGSTATDYTPYLAPSQTVITLPQTVYTGTIGSEGGESRWGEVDLGTLNWFTASPYRAASLPLAKKPQTNSDVANMLAEKYHVVARNSTNTTNDTAIDTTGTLFVRTSETPSGMLVYELTDPVQFAVPSVTIPTPSGTATTWATAEDGTVDSMEVTYAGMA